MPEIPQAKRVGSVTLKWEQEDLSLHEPKWTSGSSFLGNVSLEENLDELLRCGYKIIKRKDLIHKAMEPSKPKGSL